MQPCATLTNYDILGRFKRVLFFMQPYATFTKCDVFKYFKRIRFFMQLYHILCNSMRLYSTTFMNYHIFMIFERTFCFFYTKNVSLDLICAYFSIFCGV